MYLYNEGKLSDLKVDAENYTNKKADEIKKRCGKLY